MSVFLSFSDRTIAFGFGGALFNLMSLLKDAVDTVHVFFEDGTYTEESALSGTVCRLLP